MQSWASESSSLSALVAFQVESSSRCEETSLDAEGCLLVMATTAKSSSVLLYRIHMKIFAQGLCLFFQRLLLTACCSSMYTPSGLPLACFLRLVSVVVLISKLLALRRRVLNAA